MRLDDDASQRVCGLILRNCVPGAPGVVYRAAVRQHFSYFYEVLTLLII